VSFLIVSLQAALRSITEPRKDRRDRRPGSTYKEPKRADRIGAVPAARLNAALEGRYAMAVFSFSGEPVGRALVGKILLHLDETPFSVERRRSRLHIKENHYEAHKTTERRRVMRKILTAAWVVVFFLTGSVAYAQVTPNLAAGTKAVLFEFSGLDMLRADEFEGGVGFKYFLDAQNALRFGLQFGTSTDTDAANPTAPDTGTDGTDKTTMWGLSLALERHLTSTRVSPYIGLGAGYSSETFESKSTETGSPPPTQSIGKGGETGFDIFALLGFEFFLTSDVSLGAEYRLGYRKTSDKDDESTFGGTTTTVPGNSGSEFGIESTGMFTLAVYF
jgi:opacity protein-like surface antigen